MSAAHPLLAQLDTLDDRRELFVTLHRLPPRRRLAFLRWCCAQTRRHARSTGSFPVYRREEIDAAYRNDAGDTRLTNAVLTDLWCLVGQKGLDPVAAAVELERWGRGKPTEAGQQRAVTAPQFSAHFSPG